MSGLTFDAATHTYRLDGKVIPGVTTILKPLNDLSHIPPEVLARKAALGTAVHTACEQVNHGTLDYDGLDDEARPYVDQYLLFLEQSGFDVVLTERRVLSRKYRFAGTLDLWGYLNGRTTLADIKTTADVYPVMGLQTAAYDLALEEQDGLKTDDRVILRLGTDQYRFEPMTARDDRSVFLAALTCHHWRLRNGN